MYYIFWYVMESTETKEAIQHKELGTKKQDKGGETNMTITEQAKEFAKENELDVEINQAYIDNVGTEYATAEDVQEAYQGQHENDEDFAMALSEELGYIKSDVSWPYTCIDWEQAASELMYDYFESEGYYFRNL